MADSENTTRLEVFRTLSVAISALAVPVVVAMVGSNVTATIANAELDAEYVSLALNTLSREKPPETDQTAVDADLALRQWAVLVLQDSSPVPLSEELADDLEQGDVVLQSQDFPDFLQSQDFPDFGDLSSVFEAQSSRAETYRNELPTSGALPQGCTVDVAVTLLPSPGDFTSFTRILRDVRSEPSLEAPVVGEIEGVHPISEVRTEETEDQTALRYYFRTAAGWIAANLRLDILSDDCFP